MLIFLNFLLPFMFSEDYNFFLKSFFLTMCGKNVNAIAEFVQPFLWLKPFKLNMAECVGHLSQCSEVLTVSWLSSGPPLGLCSWSELRNSTPPLGPQADGTVSGADVDSQSSQSALFGHGSVTHWDPGLGLLWLSPDKHHFSWWGGCSLIINEYIINYLLIINYCTSSWIVAKRQNLKTYCLKTSWGF